MPDAGPSLATRTRHLEPRLRRTRRPPPAEVSRARGRPAFTVQRLPSGSARERPFDESFTPTRSARTPPVARSGRTRGRVWCSATAAACRPGASPERAGTVRLRRSRRAGPSQGPRGPATRFRGVSEGRGPLHPGLREEVRDRLHPRCLPSRSHPDLSTKLSPGIVGRVGPFPQIVTNLWRTHGAVARHWQGSRSGPAALTDGRRRGRGLQCGGAGRSPLRDAGGWDSNPIHDASAGSTPGFYPEGSLAVPAQTRSAPIDFCDRNDPRLDVPQNFREPKSLF